MAFVSRMFSSLAKGLGGGIAGGMAVMDDVFVNAAMSERYGPDWKQRRELAERKAIQDLEVGETGLETKRLENEHRLLELEGAESDAILKSGGLRAGESYSRPAYRGVTLGRPDENQFELRPVSRAEAMADRGAEEELRARRKQRLEELENVRGMAFDDAAEERARSAETRAQSAEERAAAREAREAEEFPLQQRRAKTDLAKAEEDILRTRALREKAERVPGPKEPRVPAGMFDDMVLVEARRLAPEVEQGLSEGDAWDEEGRQMRLTDYPPDVIDQAIERVTARESIPLQERRAARAKNKEALDENVARHESRRRMSIPGASGVPDETEETPPGDAGVAGAFVRDDGAEVSIKEKYKRGEALTPEEEEYVRELGRSMRKR